MAAAWSQTGARSARAVQATTEAAPAAATDGVLLTSVDSVQVVMHAPVGQTFDGTGSLLGYIWTGTAWVRAPQADVDLAAYAGLSDGALPSIPVVSPRQRFALIANAVGLSGGTQVTLDFFCTTRAGRPA